MRLRKSERPCGPRPAPLETFPLAPAPIQADIFRGHPTFPPLVDILGEYMTETVVFMEPQQTGSGETRRKQRQTRRKRTRIILGIESERDSIAGTVNWQEKRKADFRYWLGVRAGRALGGRLIFQDDNGVAVSSVGSETIKMGWLEVLRLLGAEPQEAGAGGTGIVTVITDTDKEGC